MPEFFIPGSFWCTWEAQAQSDLPTSLRASATRKAICAMLPDTMVALGVLSTPLNHDELDELGVIGPFWPRDQTASQDRDRF